MQQRIQTCVDNFARRYALVVIDVGWSRHTRQANKRTNEPTKQKKNKKTNKQTNKQTSEKNKQANKQTKKQTNEQTNIVRILPWVTGVCTLQKDKLQQKARNTQRQTTDPLRTQVPCWSDSHRNRHHQSCSRSCTCCCRWKWSLSTGGSCSSIGEH